MDTPANINTIIQTIGRIHRLGQKEVQDIYIITVDRTYDQILQAKATVKMIAQLAGEARTIGNSQEEMEENAEELITKILGQRCSRREWAELDLSAKNKLDQAPFRTMEQVIKEREIKDKFKGRAVAGNVSSRTRATKTVKSTNASTVDSDEVEPTTGNSGNDGLDKDKDGMSNNCSYQPSLLLICYVDAMSPEEEHQSDLCLNGEDGRDDFPTTPTSQGDNSTALNGDPHPDDPTLPGTSDNCSYQRLPLLTDCLETPLMDQGANSTAPNGDSHIDGSTLPGTSDNCSYQRLPLLTDCLETPLMDQVDNSTAPNGDSHIDGSPLPGTSNNRSYQRLPLLTV
jgi:hypothetical protein